MKWDPELQMWRLKVDSSKPNVFTSTDRPLDPEAERIIKARQVRLLLDAGYRPPNW